MFNKYYLTTIIHIVYNDIGGNLIIKNNIAKRIVLFLIVFSIIGTISCVSAIDCNSIDNEIIGVSTPGKLSEIHVSPDASDDMGDGSSQNPFKSIEYAINKGKTDSTIYLNDGKYVGEHNITIDKSITIIGKSKQNTIIDAEFSGRLFNVAPNSRLTLINITLLNGYSDENGGLIYSDGGEININGCIFKNSKGYENGGVIYNNLGSLNIENSCFINNSAIKYGGVLYTLGTTSIKNSNFTDNVLTSQWGVGACIASGGIINLDGCLFYKCYTPYSAAALLNLGNATVNNCRFERLSTSYTAGAISNHKYMVINNSYFGYNDVRYYAGAILAPPSGQHVITKAYNTIFEKNHAGLHGAVTNNYPNAELFMQNCALIDNYIVLNEVYGDITLDDNATVQYCWWGQNEISPYYYSPYDNEMHTERINASRWLVMTFTSDDVIYKNEVNQLTVSLKHYFDNETKEIYEYDDEFNLPLDVTFSTNVKTLATKKLVNGVATFDFNPKNGDRVVYAKINNQILKIDNFHVRETNNTDNDSEKDNGSSDNIIEPDEENSTHIPDNQSDINSGGSTDTIKNDKTGTGRLTIKNIHYGYAPKTVFSGNNYIQPSKSVKIVKSDIKDSNLKIYKFGIFTVTFKDVNNTMENITVEFNIMGTTFALTINGGVKDNVTISLKIGEYTVKIWDFVKSLKLPF
ncbi:MAG: hypothetical protein IJI42_03375 [Methanobrevibacter sp.]|nr:hypothetical protein [Methanobrevibacter sp.]